MQVCIAEPDDTDTSESRVALFETKPGSPARKELDPPDLASTIDKFLNGDGRTGESSSSTGCIVLIENIGRQMMLELGHKLSINPVFFASHIHSPNRDMSTASPNFYDLPSKRKSRTFATFPYHRTYIFPELNQEDYHLLRQSNIRRKVYVLPQISGTRIGLAQHCCSTLTISRRKNDWLGLVLVDSGLGESFVSHRQGRQILITTPTKPFLGGPEDVQPNAFIPSSDKQTTSMSMFDELVRYWSFSNANTIDISTQHSLQGVSYFPLRIIASEWVNYIAVMCFSLKQYGAPQPISTIPDLELRHITMALRTLNAWTRRVLSSKNHIGAAMCLIKHWAVIDEKLENASGSWESLLEDYEYIHVTLVDHGNQLAGSLSLVSSHLQLAEGRRAFFEAKNISRVTMLSLVFIPLGYVSSLFSTMMNLSMNAHEGCLSARVATISFAWVTNVRNFQAASGLCHHSAATPTTSAIATASMTAATAPTDSIIPTTIMDQQAVCVLRLVDVGHEGELHLILIDHRRVTRDADDPGSVTAIRAGRLGGSPHLVPEAVGNIAVDDDLSLVQLRLQALRGRSVLEDDLGSAIRVRTRRAVDVNGRDAADTLHDSEELLVRQIRGQVPNEEGTILASRNTSRQVVRREDVAPVIAGDLLEGAGQFGIGSHGAVAGGRRRLDHGRVVGSGRAVESAGGVNGRLDGVERFGIRDQGGEREMGFLLARRRGVEASQVLGCYSMSRRSSVQN
ncbi:hypothetical protein PG991_013808 [Apiospora marii]|uniref:Uncharacterized protein n=1 Tax=Apiospora marii TaxID=335849 RepID=A0ABR1R736_9PEZI